MNALKLFIFTALFINISACVSIPNTPAFDLPTGAKIGYDIVLSQEVGHAHYGTTVFNNFVKVQEGNNWMLNEFAKSEAERLILLHGYEPIEINADERFSELQELSETFTEAEFQEHADGHLELLKQNQIDAVFALRSHRNMVAMECSNFGC